MRELMDTLKDIVALIPRSLTVSKSVFECFRFFLTWKDILRGYTEKEAKD